MILALVLAEVLAAQDTAPAQREKIGEVLGQPVYRDQIRDAEPSDLRLFGEMYRLFVAPVMRKYCEDHRAEVEPTEAEIETVTAYFDERYRERMKEEGPALRQKLEDLEKRLARDDLDAERRRDLEMQRDMIQTHLEHPGRHIAVFILGHWKLERHLYDKYGGGRVLWQQRGLEAFDAMSRWLEEREAKGEFKVSDPKLRTALYEYWTTQKHGVFLTDDKDRIRTEFLEPEWAPVKPARK